MGPGHKTTTALDRAVLARQRLPRLPPITGYAPPRRLIRATHFTTPPPAARPSAQRRLRSRRGPRDAPSKGATARTYTADATSDESGRARSAQATRAQATRAQATQPTAPTAPSAPSAPSTHPSP